MTTTATEKQQIAHINRRFAKDDCLSHHKIQVTRSGTVRQNHGRFILVDTYRNALVDADNNLSELESRVNF